MNLLQNFYSYIRGLLTFPFYIPALRPVLIGAHQLSKTSGGGNCKWVPLSRGTYQIYRAATGP